MRGVAAGLALSTFAWLPVEAADMCGRTVHQKFDETRIYSRDYIAACKPGDRCRLVTYRMDEEAPLGFSHSLVFERENPDASWRVLAVDVYQLADVESGFRLAVDNKPPISVEPAVISNPDSVNEYQVSEEPSDAIMAHAKPGNRIRWLYKSQSGEEQDVAFSLIGLTAALKWADCAQQELAAGKSDPPEQEEKEPEYSPPEPDVPIDPVGDGQD